MTKQELFNKVARHLLTQGKRSVKVDTNGLGGMCMYRAPDGCKCAIGCLIPDDRYSSALEGRNLCDLDVQRAAGIPDGCLGLALALQDIHDDYAPNMWRRDLEELAYWHGLTMPGAPTEAPCDSD